MTSNNEQTITLPVSRFLTLILGYHDHVSVDHLTADVLQLIDDKRSLDDPKSCPTYHIEFEDVKGDKLREPRIWRWSAWRESVERLEKQRAYSHQQRVLRFIEQRNVELVSFGIANEWNIEGDIGRVMAWQLVKKLPSSERFIREVLEVTTITKESEL